MISKISNKTKIKGIKSYIIPNSESIKTEAISKILPNTPCINCEDSENTGCKDCIIYKALINSQNIVRR